MSPDSVILRVSLDPGSPCSMKVHAVSSVAGDGEPYHAEINPGEGLSVVLFGKRELRVERGKRVKPQG